MCEEGGGYLPRCRRGVENVGEEEGKNAELTLFKSKHSAIKKLAEPIFFRYLGEGGG